MHQYVLLITTEKPDEAALAKIMNKPACRKIGWDWFQIGGRYTGRLKPGYDPERDARNWEECKYCEGTGTRRDLGSVKKGYCNGCSSSFEFTKKKGWSVKWPTNWVKVPFDQRPVADVLEEIAFSQDNAEYVAPFSYIIDGRPAKHVELGSWYDKNENKSAQTKKFIAVLEKQPMNSWLTVVDVHT